MPTIGDREERDPRYGRDVLDTPPAHGRLRNKPATPRSSLSALTQNSPEGELGELDPAETSELDTHPVVQMFDHLGQALAHLEIVGTLGGPNVLLPVQDLITVLKQIVPQQAAAMLSGNQFGAGGMGGAMAGAPGQAGIPAGPPQMGLGMLAGVGAGPGAPMQAPMMTPGAVM